MCVLRVVFCVLCVRTTQNYRSTKSNYKETTRSETTSVGSRSTCVSLHRSSKGSFSTSHTHITYTHTDTPHGDKNRKKFLSRLEPMSTRTLRIRSSSCTITLSYCPKRKEQLYKFTLEWSAITWRGTLPPPLVSLHHVDTHCCGRVCSWLMGASRCEGSQFAYLEFGLHFLAHLHTCGPLL